MQKENKIKRVVITGPESTGKTELAKFLSMHYNTTFVPEYARNYVENLNHRYSFVDVENIAKKQIELEKEKLREANKILFYDTWLIITKVWFLWVFNKCPEWLLYEIENLKIDLFLVCDIDIPWVPDLVRENGGENRKKLYKHYIHELNSYNFVYKVVQGQGPERFNKALSAVNELYV